MRLYPLDYASVSCILRNTRRFAKSQRTWFKTFHNVNWIDITEDDTVETVLQKAVEKI